MDLYFSDIFNVSPKVLDKYGAFNISLVTDLPLFIDPFLLFNSKRKEYRQLHDNLRLLFADFGSEKVTKSSHLEKLCLIKEGVGRDTISEFTTNLIKEYLLNY